MLSFFFADFSTSESHYVLLEELISLPKTTANNSQHLRHYLPREMTSEQRVQEFHVNIKIRVAASDLLKLCFIESEAVPRSW